ncbi:2OG-Fe(II) oxygenase [Yoonia sp.]|uniref:2OG-Fe(II) oxygenase n=1 Tax=Yoonia sp. TaxID=2212373 RepID=UPI0025FD4601|nr:2OG-Fe(II) oxygenase [Yoonia sp.]
MISLHTTPEGFSAVDCDRLSGLAAAAPAQDAGLVGRARDHNLRRADLVWTDDIPGAEWVMDRIIDLVRGANRQFGFDLSAFHESPQIARYDAAREGHFDWHADIGDGPFARQRKLTMVAQMSDPADYDGGQLEIMPSAQVHRAASARGTVTIFPSYVLHRVTPVTRGARLSLTVWAHGPAFR